MSVSTTADSTGAPPPAHEKLGLGMLVTYSSGQFVDAMVATGLARFLPIFLTGMLGLSGTLAGLTGLISLTVDAVSDPLIGSLSDNSNSPRGRRHPFMLAGLIPVGLGLGLLFSLPRGLPLMPTFGLVTIILVAARIGHSAYNLPYVALGAEMSEDYQERTIIVAARNLMNVVAASACIIIGLSVFLKDGQSPHDSYVPMYGPMGWTFAALSVAGGLVCVLGTARLRGRLHKVDKPVGSVLSRLVRDVVEIFRNRSFRTLFFTCMLVFSGLGAVLFLQPFALLLFWRLPASVIQLIYLGPTLGGLPGIAVTIVLARFFEKKAITGVGVALFAICQIAPVALRVLGLLPLEGSMLHTVLVVNELLVGVGLGMAAVGFQSMMADAADEHEHVYGTRREGLFFAGLNFGLKAAAGVGGLIGGIALDLVRIPGSAIGSAAVRASLPANATTHLALIYGPGASLFTIAAGLIFMTYRLDSKRHAAILQELNVRRAAKAQADVSSEPA